MTPDGRPANRPRLLARSTAPSLAMLCVLCGCLSLDPFLFSGEELDGYRLDDYAGTTECGDALDSLGPLAEGTAREVALQSGSETIRGILVHDTTSRPALDTVILYLHGNADHIDYYWPRTRLLHATGYPVFVFDYRGYGKSTGSPTEEGIYEDGRSALAYLRSLGSPAVVVYAFSLGSLVGVKLAAEDTRGEIIALVLEAPIGSVGTLVGDATYLDMPGSYVSTYTGNNAERIKQVSVPLLWLHGTADETLDHRTNGRAIWDNYGGEAGYCIIVEEGGHGTLPQTLGYNTYVRSIDGFIRARVPDWVSCRK